MDMMYNASIQIHFGLIVALMGVMGFNAAMLQFAVQGATYVRRARIAMPLSVSLIAGVIFTGIVMMAAKHLDFTLENIAMIAITLFLIVMESRRYKRLRRMRTSEEGALNAYRPYALKLLGAELAVTVVMTFWMIQG